jgi:hypothetical protein
MKTARSRKRITLPVRVLHLSLLAVLLTNPALAAVSAFSGCNSTCCCYSSADQKNPIVAIGGPHKDMACCGSTGSTACRMSVIDRPQTPPAMIPNPGHTRSGSGSIGFAGPPTVGHLLLPRITLSSIDTAPQFQPSRLYLSICRFIC